MADTTVVKSVPSTNIFRKSSSKHIHSIDLTLTLEEKNAWLDAHSKVIFFFLRKPQLGDWILKRSILDQVIIKSLVFIDQAEKIFHFPDSETISWLAECEHLVEQLSRVEEFYAQMGGIVGYHFICLDLIEQQKSKLPTSSTTYYPPQGIDFTDKEKQKYWSFEGIKTLKNVAEIYPVGGAADRLNLHDEKTHSDLPAARLEFLGRTLLEGMIRDLQAKESLYYRLFDEHICIPVALMTSTEKNNHQLIGEILSQQNYFGKGKEAFFLFSQPMVPTLTQDGSWSLSSPMKLLMKPGGHGVLWKLAKEKQVLSWLKQQGKEKILIRQINNPIAGTDSNLLAFLGVGAKKNKAFGFASCPRRVKTSEGMNIIKKIQQDNECYVVLSNIEYCDFEKCGIEDIPAEKSEQPYSIFPSNTNLLFADLNAIEQAVEALPFPGMLVNFKKMSIYDPDLGMVQSKVARLELLMQNIADAFEIPAKQGLDHGELPAYITFNERHKTISPTKKEFVPGSGLVETAFGCYFDYLKNARELLSFCGFEVPELPREDLFLKEGPSFVFIYHPGLGPIYDIIAQKIQAGKIHLGSELQLEIADVYFRDVEIEGSLLIDAKQPLGHLVEQKICYSPLTGRCILKNVKIQNRGIDRDQEHTFWKNKIEREETCYIQLQGYSEFIAENVILDGDYHVIVKDGERVIATQQGDEVVFKKEIMDKKQAVPLYAFIPLEDGKIILEKKESIF